MLTAGVLDAAFGRDKPAERALTELTPAKEGELAEGPLTASAAVPEVGIVKLDCSGKDPADWVVTVAIPLRGVNETTLGPDIKSEEVGAVARTTEDVALCVKEMDMEADIIAAWPSFDAVPASVCFCPIIDEDILSDAESCVAGVEDGTRSTGGEIIGVGVGTSVDLKGVSVELKKRAKFGCLYQWSASCPSQSEVILHLLNNMTGIADRPSVDDAGADCQQYHELRTHDAARYREKVRM